MDYLDEEILKLWSAFHKHNVAYILVGGFATNLHGFSRTTADMDVWIKDTPSNRKNLKKALAELELGDFENIESMQFLPGWSTITLSSGFDLDIMTELKGFTSANFDECYYLSPTAIIENVPIKFLHINKLIEEKKASGRPKDLLDLIELEKIRNQSS